MPTVSRRNVDLIFKYIIYKLYARIILKKIPRSSLDVLRKVEKYLKNIYKCKADIQFLKFGK